MKILVTGFTPFGGEQINPSWEAARRLPNRIGGAELIKHEIPTEFDASGAALHKLLTELRPDAVLCVGQYGGRAGRGRRSGRLFCDDPDAGDRRRPA